LSIPEFTVALDSDEFPFPESFLARNFDFHTLNTRNINIIMLMPELTLRKHRCTCIALKHTFAATRKSALILGKVTKGWLAKGIPPLQYSPRQHT
jgi:hypothetical protein